MVRSPIQSECPPPRSSRSSAVFFALSLVSALLLSVDVARAAITLDADFDSASLDLANSSVVGNTVLLAGRDNFNPGAWKWVHFRADGVAGLRPTFQIDDGFATGGSRLNDHEMVYSYDGQTWEFFDFNNRDASADTFTFRNHTPFTSDSVYVAYGLPYPNQMVVDHVQSLASNPWVQPTASANESLVIGSSPGGVDDLGRTIAPNDLFGFRITDPASALPKEKVVALGGVHANETLGNHTLQGMVDFLVSDDPVAAELRRHAEFFIYPMANPDGRVAGYNRSTVQHVDRDPNRFWREDLYADMDDLRTVGEAMKADTGADVRYFIDFHSFTDTEEHFGYVSRSRGFHLDPFWVALTQREPELGSRDSALVDWTGARFGLDRLGADFSMTFETMFIPGQNVDRFHTLGENFGRALHDAIVPTPLSEDFRFDEPAGTRLSEAGNAGSFRRFSADINGAFTTGVGTLRIRKTGDDFAASYVDIENTSTGVLYLVAEIAGWAFGGTFDPGEPEEVRFGLLDSDGTSGATITAQMEIERAGQDTVALQAQALGAGTDLAALVLSASRSEPMTLVLEVDLDADRYQVFFREGDGPYAALGDSPGLIDPFRDANSLRLVVNNSFSAAGEFFDLDRLFLTTQNPMLSLVPGDADGDGDVDAFDLGLWQTQFGSIGSGLSADFDGDGDVDAFDLGLWQTHFGTGVPDAAAPEPGVLATMLLAAVAVTRRRCM